MFDIGSRIKDHPDLARPARGGGVVNLNEDDYRKASLRLESGKRQKELERKVDSLEKKLDTIIQLLGDNHGRQG